MTNLKFDFSNQKFIVAGASSGMGRQVAVELAEAGAKVLALARRRNLLEELHATYPDNIQYRAVDVSDAVSVEGAISEFVSSYGKINGLVYTVGVDYLTSIKAYDENEACVIFDSTFWAAMKLVQLSSKLKFMEQRGSIVLFSSVAAMYSEKAKFVYSAAKAGLNIAVKSIAKELAGRKIRINTVCPGIVKTELVDKLCVNSNFEEAEKKHLLGIGEPSDVSGIVLFLLSDRASWITGTNVVVDGGFLA